MPPVLGAIADDFTGATDLCSTLVAGGLRTVQAIGVPRGALPEADAVVIALKSRTIPAENAVARSLEALAWLRDAGARQILFKYCSTFDSTDAGNIGPVADALLDALDAPLTVFCPAFPTNRRTVYKGHLFVGDVLLSDSGMRDHPLTPMRDASLVRVLGRQTPHRVGLVPVETVEAGAAAVRAALDALAAATTRHAVLDALTDRHLLILGEALADLPLVTGGSGIALGLPENFRRTGLAGAAGGPAVHPVDGAAAVIAGSCSEATRAQVAAMATSRPAFRVEPDAAVDGSAARDALAWAGDRLGTEPLLFYSSADPDAVRATQDRHGRDAAGAAVERAMGTIAEGIVTRGARRLVVAGGETAGAVVSALGVTALEIGREIDPGVPWTYAVGGMASAPGAGRLALALKSGNFGADDFFTRAFEALP